MICKKSYHLKKMFYSQCENNALMLAGELSLEKVTINIVKIMLKFPLFFFGFHFISILELLKEHTYNLMFYYFIIIHGFSFS